MLVKLLGAVDIAAAIALFGMGFWDWKIFCLVAAALVGIKAVIFMGEGFASLIDMAAVVFMLLAALGHNYAFTFLFTLWLLQKGVRSLF